MINAETETGTATEGKRKKTMEALVEEAVVVEAEIEEEAVEATTTTTMVKKVVATSMEVEAA